MRGYLWSVLLGASLVGCGRPATSDDRVARLEQQVTDLASRVARLEDGARPADAGDADRTTRPTPPAQVETEEDRAPLTHDVEFELGDVEFRGGDGIEILAVRGDRPTFEVGGTYEVRGRYQLASDESARLLLSVTGNQPNPTPEPTPRSASTRVSKGEGEFCLRTAFTRAGKPHLTFYGATTGKPFGGVYFGAGDWLLRTNRRHYTEVD